MQNGQSQTEHLDAALDDWQRGDVQSAISKLDVKRPIDQVLKTAIAGQQQGLNLAVLKEELTRIATKRLDGLSAYLRPLEVIATISPLLGLLGTVLGMIEAFQQMQAAGSQGRSVCVVWRYLESIAHNGCWVDPLRFL